LHLPDNIILQNNNFEYTIEPAWFLDQKQTGFDPISISPLVSDLDGDGSHEIILISNDNNLLVLEFNCLR